jgi:AMMECR1 domain-containing protein
VSEEELGVVTVVELDKTDCDELVDARDCVVTWNTVSKHGHKSLRGCIGTFEAQELAEGLKSYALTSPGSGKTEYHQMRCGRLACASLAKV